MATILSNFNPSFKTHQVNSVETKTSTFTCLSCQVVFPSSDRQRAHYRTDWHKYNLKRKVAQLVPLSAEVFSEKVLAQQALNKEENDKQGLVYECRLCKKEYISENGYNNHIQSKKHLEFEQLAEENETSEDDVMEEPQNHSLFDSEPSSLASSRVIDSTMDCLFCSHSSADVDANLTHMDKTHGFFLPDVEYLQDKEGLLKYLSIKINSENMCLYCNGRGKEWQSRAAAKAHMIDRGHCKMAYDESENPEELLNYYNFGIEEEAMDIDNDPTSQDNELVLHNGAKVGHRKFLNQYKRNTARKTLAISESEEAQQVQQAPETLRRKEKRHLTITDGSEQQLEKTAAGIKEVTIKQDFERNLSLKQNRNRNLRYRTQNPI